MNAYIKTALRDRSCDRFTASSIKDIVSNEKSSLKSSARASEMCSTLTAYRLLDIMYALEHPDDGIKAPQHRRLPVDFSSSKVTNFYYLHCHNIHLENGPDLKTTHRLDIDPQVIPQAT